MKPIEERHATHAASMAQGGMSLVELMVAVTIALMMSLAIFSTLSSSEGRKRTLTSVNDLTKVGSYAAYQLDKTLRSAGSGFSQSADFSYGCLLQASLPSKVILPFGTSPAMAVPFDTLNTTLGGNYRMAPLVIVKDATQPAVSGSRSDALIVMSGAAGFGEVTTLFTAPATSSQINLQNTVAFRAGDLILMTDTAGAAGPVPCMVEQVATGFSGGVATALPLGGNYTANPIGTTNLTGYSTVATALNLGAGNGANPPTMTILAVGANNTLFSYDLLQMGTYNQVQEVADGIFEMHALYGVDTNNDGTVDTWVDPGSTNYLAATLESGSAASVATLRTIKAIRIGLILRTSLPEKAPVAPATPATVGPLKLFTDLGGTLAFSRSLVGAEQNFRYRTVELTVPLRNTLLLK